MEQPERSMLMAGISFVIRGIFVVLRERGNTLVFSLCAPLGEIKYAHMPKAFSSLFISTLRISVFKNALRIQSCDGFFGLKRLILDRLDDDLLCRMLSVLIPKKHMSATISLSRFSAMNSLISGCV